MFSFLVVDDDQDAADSLADVCRLAGHDCVVAYDGKSALDEARRFHVDVVILDIHMPVLDGYETARCFMNSQELERPLLIALTAHASPDARVNAMRSGFDGFLAKPANPNRLLDLVAKLKAERRAALVSHASLTRGELPDGLGEERAAGISIKLGALHPHPVAARHESE